MYWMRLCRFPVSLTPKYILHVRASGNNVSVVMETIITKYRTVDKKGLSAFIYLSDELVGK